MSDSKLNTDLSITTFSVVGTQEHLGDPFIHSSFVKGDLHSFITVACMILIIFSSKACIGHTMYLHAFLYEGLKKNI